MKFKTLSATAIVAALTAVALSPIAASAVATELASDGTVNVKEGTGGGPDAPTIDVENPGEVLPKPDVPDTENPNPDSAPLMIEKTSDLDFGSAQTQSGDQKLFAKPMKYGAETRGAFVQWTDVRAGGTYGYEVTAELTQQFTGTAGKGSTVLSNSTIDFTYGLLAVQGSNTNPAPSVFNPAFQLAFAGGAKKVAIADKVKQEGKGRYIAGFGQSATSAKGTPATDGKAVFLTIPSATSSNMAVDTYTAKITWKIVAAQ